MQPVFDFADYRLDLNTKLLTVRSRKVAVAPKALEVLAVLLERANEIVCKEELLRLVWPGSIVEEANVAVYISALRKALDASPASGVSFETIPRRGYRLVADVCRVPPPGADTGDLFRLAEHFAQQQTAAGFRSAEGVYRECIKSDPEGVSARARLADVLLLRHIVGDLALEEAQPHASQLLRVASEMDRRCGAIHLANSRLQVICHWRWGDAEEALRAAADSSREKDSRALAFAWLGSFLVRRGEIDRGLDYIREAETVRRLCPIVASLLADALIMAREFEKCLDVCMGLLRLHPALWLLHRAAARSLTALNHYPEALVHLRRASALPGCVKPALLADTAYIHAVSGRAQLAYKLMATLQPGSSVSGIQTGAILAAAGERRRAMSLLQSACAAHDWYVIGLKQDSRLDCLRGTPEFRALLSRVGV